MNLKQSKAWHKGRFEGERGEKEKYNYKLKKVELKMDHFTREEYYESFT